MSQLLDPHETRRKREQRQKTDWFLQSLGLFVLSIILIPVTAGISIIAFFIYLFLTNPDK